MVSIKSKKFGDIKVNPKSFYMEVYEYLLKTGKENCQLDSGELISRDMCCEVIYK